MLGRSLYAILPPLPNHSGLIYKPVIVGAGANAASMRPFLLKGLVLHGSVMMFSTTVRSALSSESLTHRGPAQAL